MRRLGTIFGSISRGSSLLRVPHVCSCYLDKFNDKQQANDRQDAHLIDFYYQIHYCDCLEFIALITRFCLSICNHLAPGYPDKKTQKCLPIQFDPGLSGTQWVIMFFSIFRSCPESELVIICFICFPLLSSSACPVGQFKSGTDGQCTGCPGFSHATIRGASVCACRSGYLRAESDSPDTPCTSKYAENSCTDSLANLKRC